jgi:probable HAF family extracellular repeat protein
MNQQSNTRLRHARESGARAPTLRLRSRPRGRSSFIVAVLLAVAVAFALVGGSAATTPEYTSVDLRLGSTDSSFPVGIGNGGRVAGNDSIGAGHTVLRAWFWTPEDGMVALPDLGGVTEAHAVNNLGQVVGSSGGHAFSWTKTGGMIDIGALLPTSTYPNSRAGLVNDAGQVALSSSGSSPSHAWLWSAADGLVDLGTLGSNGPISVYAINASGWVVGPATVPPGGQFHAFLWRKDSGMKDLGSLGGSSEARAVSDEGQIVGCSDVSSGVNHAFSWTQAGGMVDIGTLPGSSYACATDVNDAGQIVGYSYMPDGFPHAFSRTPAGEMVDLGPEAPNPTVHVNASGQVAWVGRLSNGELHNMSWTQEGGLLDLTPPGTSVNPTLATIGLNESGEIAGVTSISQDLYHATLWEPTTADTTAPVLTVPTDMTVEATSAAGATMSFSASATDNVDPSPVVECSPASGTVFPVGNTTVTCTATDASGNHASASFVVTVDPIPGQSPPANDMFANPQPLDSVTPPLSASNVNATKEAGELDHAADGGGASVWYSWTPTFFGTAYVSTQGSDFDTLVGVYVQSSSSFSGLEVVAENDDARVGSGWSEACFPVVHGTTYRIAVDGYGADEGKVALDWGQYTSSHPCAVQLPRISGTMVTGARLSVSNGTWAGTPAGFTYGWGACDSDECFTLHTNNSTYTVPAELLGDRIYAWVIANDASDPTFDAVSIAALTGPIAPGAPSTGGGGGSGGGGGGGGSSTVAVTLTPASQSIASGGTANWTVSVTNTGGAYLYAVTVADAAVPGCLPPSNYGDTLYFMPPGLTVSYGCSLANVTASTTNTVTVTATTAPGDKLTTTASASVTVTGGSPLTPPTATTPPATKHVIALVRPVIGKAVAVPARPRGGKAMLVSFKVTRSDTGGKLTSGKMICDPRIGSHMLKHAEQFKNGTASLRFTIPKTATGKLLKVHLTIRLGTRSATRIATFHIS